MFNELNQKLKRARCGAATFEQSLCASTALFFIETHVGPLAALKWLTMRNLCVAATERLLSELRAAEARWKNLTLAQRRA
jgi:hypothetical protein